MNKAIQAFLALTQREQQFLAIGVFAVLATALYVGVIEPLYIDSTRLQLELADSNAQLDRVRRITQSMGIAPKPIAADDTSVLSRVDTTAKASGLERSLRRMQPDGDTRVRVTLESARFDAVVDWLGRLDNQHGVMVMSMSLEPTTDSGVVSGSVLLERS